MIQDKEIINGVFIKECKNRFICEVSINGEIQECYVPSSSKMENYLKLKGKQVLLSRNKVRSRTKYSLFAVKYYNKYILLNQNLVNFILESVILKEFFSNYSDYKVLKEYTIDGYKSDLTLVDPNEQSKVVLVIEAKSIISINKTSVFPKVYSERAEKQLIKIKDLLKKGYNVSYCFISLSPFVKCIQIEETANSFSKLLEECISEGLQIKGVSLKYENGEILVNKKIDVRTTTKR